MLYLIVIVHIICDLMRNEKPILVAVNENMANH